MALFVLSTTQWWTTTRIHVSGDESVRDQIRQLPDGRVEYQFAERVLLISNHQVIALFCFFLRLSSCSKILLLSAISLSLSQKRLNFYSYTYSSTTTGSTSGTPPTPTSPVSTATSTSSSKNPSPTSPSSASASASQASSSWPEKCKPTVRASHAD